MSHQDLYKEIACHNNEELEKIAKDIIAYCSDGLREMKVVYGDQTPPIEVRPQLEFYKHLRATATEYLIRTNSIDEVIGIKPKT